MAGHTGDLVFINATGPEGSQSRSVAKTVRSHAARSQHRQTESTEESSAVRTRYSRQRKKRVTQLSVALDVTDPQTYRANMENPRTAEGRSGWQNEAVTRRRLDPNRGIDDSAEIPGIPQTPGAAWVYPAAMGAAATQLFVPGILNHYIVALAVDVPELDAPGNRGLLRSLWFPMVLSASPTFDVVLLISASHYLATYPGMPDGPRTLRQLKHSAIQSINRDLQRLGPAAVTDELIGAVAKMASYEAMFGTAEAYHLHMAGLGTMLRARGGLESLGLNGLLARMVLWIDINSAFLLRSTPYFGMVAHLPGYLEPPRPNPGHFLGAS